MIADCVEQFAGLPYGSSSRRTDKAMEARGRGPLDGGADRRARAAGGRAYPPGGDAPPRRQKGRAGNTEGEGVGMG